jgi:hypothetical protein
VGYALLSSKQPTGPTASSGERSPVHIEAVGCSDAVAAACQQHPDRVCHIDQRVPARSSHLYKEYASMLNPKSPTPGCSRPSESSWSNTTANKGEFPGSERFSNGARMS